VTTLKNQKNTPARRESILFLATLLFGLFFLPAAIYLVGQAVFGEYSGTGIAEFYGRIYSGLGTGDGVIWFLILSLYLGVQMLRLTIWLFRRNRRRLISPPG
jgi:uncharacterized membrane protein